MTIKKRDKAPKEEWVLMYRHGLNQRQIADLVGSPRATVNYHLRKAQNLDPGLQAAHIAASATKPARVTAQGVERMHQLIAMVQESGRYPSRQSDNRSERALAAWLQRRRQDARAQTLSQAFRDGLSVLPDWQTPPRAESDEDRWQERLTALARYRSAGNDWPRHKANTSGEEHDLGVWLHSQRYKFRRGELRAEKTKALDSELPGWRVGRKRGRRPRLPGD